MIISYFNNLKTKPLHIPFFLRKKVFTQKYIAICIINKQILLKFIATLVGFM